MGEAGKSVMMIKGNSKNRLYKMLDFNILVLLAATQRLWRRVTCVTNI